jgi:acyl-CoA hydrolase
MGEAHAILVKWMSVTDANSAGFIHGGTVMKLCAEAAGLAAIRHARQRAVTAAVDRLTFLHPVDVGDVLTLSASVNAAWGAPRPAHPARAATYVGRCWRR